MQQDINVWALDIRSDLYKNLSTQLPISDDRLLKIGPIFYRLTVYRHVIDRGASSTSTILPVDSGRGQYEQFPDGMVHRGDGSPPQHQSVIALHRHAFIAGKNGYTLGISTIKREMKEIKEKIIDFCCKSLGLLIDCASILTPLKTLIRS